MLDFIPQNSGHPNNIMCLFYVMFCT